MEGIIDQPKTEASPLLTHREAAAYLKLSPRFGYMTVQRWARLGILRGGKVGDHWRFKRSDLDDFVFTRK